MLTWPEGLTTTPVHALALLLLCAPYLIGAAVKAWDFPGAVAEMREAGLAPPRVMALAVILLEAGASAMILSAWHRWLGALLLAGFTLAASLLAGRFWRLPKGPLRQGAINTFLEHGGLAGGFLLVAWIDLGGLHGLG